ncbi:hypothetical protein [Hymenobacter sp. PAMC 26628]|uniref:hypothetical protein n=1 Tax=Hymenobacter sp. PAMC 26628 TaxID=1484118 RepID=UPI0007700BCC|nr:hypothetical protein [Hymenobacter sp. PAMC 26628]AMJ65459.1 hypothetical protein AXW84_08475 [Hymenobacter sp. PAMC 26628]
MIHATRFAVFARAGLLPGALVLGTVAGLGSYCEANDETVLAWLFAGVLAPGPVPSLPLYLHGYGHVLAAAYGALPGVPWLGLLLSALLGTATGLWFAVLDELLRPHLRPGPLALTLVAFFGGAWLEHWLWFSHARVPLLLAGAAVLYAAQRPGRWGPLLLGLLSLGAAWLVRPGLAVVGAAAAVPAAVLLAGGWRRAAPVLAGAALLLAGATGAAALGQTPAEGQTQTRDAFFARVLDFEQLRPQPRTPADGLGTAAVNLWLLGDSTAVNEALARRAYRFDAREFFGRTVPAKLGLRAGLLVRDYFPVLLALGALAGGVARRRGPQRPAWGFWLVQVGFAGALVVLAGGFKLPPRLALPLLDFWLLANLAFWLEAPGAGRVGAGPLVLPPAVRRWGALAALAVGALYAAKTGHRRLVLGQECARHERALAELAGLTAGRVRVLAGATDLLKSLSPFRAYSLGPGPVLSLSGWAAHDASQRALCRALTGAPGQAEALRRLAWAPAGQVAWVLAAPEAAWLNAAARRGPPGQWWALRRGPALAADSSLRFYYPGALGKPLVPPASAPSAAP